MPPILLACLLVATDGDTLRCGAERIRLVGIDAPELPGHCRRGRHCAPGDPWASKAALAARLPGPDDPPARIERFGFDRYGRTLARVSVGSADLGCAQLAAGMAVYRRDWDIDAGEAGCSISSAAPTLDRTDQPS